jgi:small subunit ribosomal protein S2
MKPYIFTERNGIHIIDLQQTLSAIENAYVLVRDTVSQGEPVLFVGTKRQAQEAIEQQAMRANQPFITHRWLGGTLTNWRTIRQRIDTLVNLEARRDAGEFERLTKKEALLLSREIEKLKLRLGGIRDMKRLPGALFIVDVRREATAVREANVLNIPIVAMVDTNCDPDPIDHVIPSNDDAIRAIKLVVSKMADAALEGLAMRKETLPAEEAVEEGVPEAEEKYLGAATLAKLRSGQLEFEEGEETEEGFEDEYESEA